MSGVIAGVIIVRLIWWLVRSDILRNRPAPVEKAPPPRETGFPERPELGGYGMTPPEPEI